jgi:hypothetical protein
VADDKIVISIELDNGTVLKGLANIENKAKQTGKSVKGVGDQIEDAFSGTPIGNATNSLTGFIKKIKTVHPALLAVAAAAAGVASSFAAALEGEKINALNKQFEILGNQVGASLTKLRAELESAAGGVVDFEDVLKSSNKFLIEFGSNVDRLPEVLNLARKATALFGGEVTQNFEQIAQAIVSGQTRSLKSLGIIVDQEAAYRKFADSIGVASGALSDAGKKQAILNEILLKGGDTFKNVDPNISQLSVSVDRLKVQLGDIFDEVALRASSVFGDIFTSAINKTADALERLTKKPAEDGLGKISEEITTLETKIDDLNSKLQMNKDALSKFIVPNAAKIRQNSKELLADRQKLLDELEKSQQRFLKFQQASNAPDASNKDNSLFVDQEKLAENLAKLKAQVIAAKQDRINAESALDLSNEERIKLRDERLALNEQSLALRLAEIRRVSAEQGLLNTETNQALITEVMKRAAAEREKIVSENEEKLMVKAIISAQNINQGVSRAIQSTVMAAAKGQNAFKAFGSSILSFIGDILIQIGTAVLGIGQAMESIRNSIVSMTGGPAIFAGIALIGLGTLLKSLSGGSGGDSGGGGIASGGASTEPSTIEQPEIEEQKPLTQVAVNISGDVLDSRDTGLRIVDLIKEYTDRNGRTEVLA